MELTPEEKEFLKQIQKITEKFKADFKEKEIVYDLLGAKHQAFHDNMDALDVLAKNRLANATIKPQAEGVSLKKKEDIGKKTFVDEILAWAIATTNDLKKLSKDDTPILIKELKIELSTSLQLAHVINKAIYNGLCKALPDTLVPATRAKASAEMIKLLSSFTKSNLEKLFKDNKDIRKDLADDKSLKPNILPTPSTLYDVLMLPGVEDKNNAEHPTKKADAEKAKEDFNKEVFQFRKDFANATEVVLLDSLVIKSRLVEELKKVIALNKKADPYILNKLLNISIPTDRKLTVDDVLTSIDAQAQLLYEDENLLKESEKRKIEFPYAAHFVAAVEKSMTAANPEYFAEGFDKWKKKVEGIFQGTDKKWRFDKEKLLKEMSVLFVNEGQFLNTLISSIISSSKSSIIPLSNKLMNEKSPTDFEEIWKNVFAKADAAYLKEVYKMFVENATSAEEIENFISVMDSKLPDANMIWATLGFSRHFDTKTPAPASTDDTLAVSFVLNPKDSSKLGKLGLNLSMGFDLKPFEMNKQIVYQAIVNTQKIVVGKDNEGRFSFSEPRVIVKNIKTDAATQTVTYNAVLSFDVKDDAQKSTSIEVTEGHYSIGGEMPIVGFDASYTEENTTHTKGDSFGAGREITLSISMNIISMQNKNFADVSCQGVSFEGKDGGFAMKHQTKGITIKNK